MAKVKGVLIGVLVLVFLMGFQNISDAAPLALGTTRIAGVRQVDTAIEISKTGWQKANTVLLANCDHFPDALVAAPLSHKLDAPILLTPAGGVDSKVLEEINRLGAQQVILIGGEAVLSPKVVSDIESLGLSKPERIAGYDQYETAQKVAERVGNKGQVILANGEQFPDALAISAFAGVTETPILLTSAKKMPAATQQELNTLQQKGALNTIVVGGEAVVSKAILGGLSFQRISGNDRYETAAAVYEFAKDELTSQTIYLVTGENFPDALAAGGLAAKQRAEIVMTQKSTLPGSTYSVLSSPTESSMNVVIIGGYAAITDQVKAVVQGDVKPSYLLAGVTIVLDPGHGTPDSGAVGYSKTTYEKDDNLAIAQKLATQLRAVGASVYLTRTGDDSPASPTFNLHNDLWSRVNMANDLRADLFISIHSNSWTAQSHGAETHYSSINEFNTYSESFKLANSIQASLVKNIGLTDRGLVDSDFTVLNHTKMPAVLVEVAFISNQTEEQLLANDSFRQKAATGIYQGVLTYEGF